MAAGLIKRTVTLTSGEDTETFFYVLDTGVPGDDAYAAKVLVNGAGGIAAFGSGANGATVLRVALATDSPPGTGAYSAAATFTPANTSHAAGDVVGGAQQFSLAAPSGSRIMINSAWLEIDNASAQATAWTLYLYNVTPPSAIADDSPWDLASGDRTAFLGLINLGTAADLVSTQWVETNGIQKQIVLSGTSVFGYLVNGTTLTTPANAHIVTLHTTLL